jgi:hypothetical protein
MKLLIGILSFLTILILGVVYVKISTPKPLYVETSKENEIKKKVEKLKSPVVYNFPARVLYMRIDFRNYRNVILYRVVLNIKDRFELFNLKALLNNFDIVYSLIEEKKKIKVYILFKSLAEAEKILNLFKEYNFKAKIEKIKQRI